MTLDGHVTRRLGRDQIFDLVLCEAKFAVNLRLVSDAVFEADEFHAQIFERRHSSDLVRDVLLLNHYSHI